VIRLSYRLVVNHAHLTNHSLEQFHDDFWFSILVDLLALSMLRLEFSEISLVLSFFVLKLADLLDLVVVNRELAALELGVLKFFLGLLCTIRSLEADEAVWVLALLLLKESDTLNLTEPIEELSDIFLLAFLRNVFDEKVALFLGILVLHGFASDLSLTFSLTQELFDVKLFVFNLCTI